MVWFSIIIPVYNKSKTIYRALESVMNQNLCRDEFEVIIVDDGSTDFDYTTLNNTGVHVIKQKNSGVSKARNTGIEYAQGKYICFLDADDWYLPNNLAVLKEAIETTNGDFYCTIPIINYANGTSSKNKLNLVLDGRIEDVDIFEYYLSHHFTFIHTDSVCIRKEILSTMKFENGEKIGEDFDLWFRLGMHYGLKIIYANTVVYDRTESTATKDRNVISNWHFAKRTRDENFFKGISVQKKNNIIKIIDRYYLTEAREYKIKGDKIHAKKIILKITNNRDWRYWVTWMFINCPPILMNIIINLYEKYQDR